MFDFLYQCVVYLVGSDGESLFINFDLNQLLFILLYFLNQYGIFLDSDDGSGGAGDEDDILYDI